VGGMAEAICLGYATLIYTASQNIFEPDFLVNTTSNLQSGIIFIKYVDRNAI
jgi:hypothetical protein